MSYLNPYQPYQSYQPYQQTQDLLRQQYQPQNGILWVNNEMEAMNYMMAPNSAVALFDLNSPLVYQKQTDASGKPTIRVFELRERGIQKNNDDFVTRKEWEEFLRRQESMRKDVE